MGSVCDIERELPGNEVGGCDNQVRTQAGCVEHTPLGTVENGPRHRTSPEGAAAQFVQHACWSKIRTMPDGARRTTSGKDATAFDARGQVARRGDGVRRGREHR